MCHVCIYMFQLIFLYDMIHVCILYTTSYARLRARVQNAGNNIPLSQQVRLFESTKAEMEAAVGQRAVRKLLSASFFLVSAGSNDFFAFATAMAEQNRTATQADVTAFYGSLLSNYSATITVRGHVAATTTHITN